MVAPPPHVIGNWKMNGSKEFVAKFFDELIGQAQQLTNSVSVTICPPLTLLGEASRYVSGTQIALGAQDVSAEAEGAHTGDVSAAMLLEWGVQRVILGHSERRAQHGESSELVALKARTALAAGLQPIICVGETLAERESGRAEQVVQGQLQAVKQVLQPARLAQCLVAYEPVWAIGTGLAASPEQAQQMHAFIRAELGDPQLPLLYGGSLKAKNAGELFAQPDIDGGLIGGASLNAQEFIAICQAADQKMKG